MAGSNFHVDASELDAGVTRVRLAGDVDLSVAPLLRQSLTDLVRRGHTKLLIDLTGVTFIDSSALGVLLSTVRRLRRRRGGLAVLCPNPQLRGLFELVGHNLIFPVDETFEQALRHLHVTGRPTAPPHALSTPARSGPPSRP